MKPAVTIPAFDAFLAAKDLHLEGVAIGGSALNLLGVVDRETRDCDILAPPLSEEVLEAARAFARQQRAAGTILRDDWLNNGPESLARILPPGWQNRVVPLFAGKAVRLSALGRADLLKTKLFAYCDRRTDLDDCIALAPTKAELDEALPWVEYQDANELWPAHVRAMFAALSGRLGHGV